MRFSVAVAAFAALATSAVAQDSQTWQDATVSSAPAADQATSTVTKTLSFMHTETVWGQSANSTVPSSTVSVPAQTSSPVEATSSPVIATPTGISGAAAMSFDVVFAIVAAGAVTFWAA